MMNVFDDLFKQVISLWPDSLIVSEKIMHKNGGATIPAFATTHEEIENTLFAIDDNEMLLKMDWAVFTVLHQIARAQDEIFPNNIDVKMVREVFQKI